MTTAKHVRVRFAPSPTGHLHIGGARTALFNYLFARNEGGSFILRIEDTDRERNTVEAVHHIIDGMKWLGMDWDEGPEVGGDHGPYTQLERLDIYHQYAQTLLDKGSAYYCYCTPEELDEKRKLAMKRHLPPKYDRRCRSLSDGECKTFEGEGKRKVIRFATPDRGETSFTDLIKGRVGFKNGLLDDFVIMKSDGIPTYNFAAVVDDHLMNITHVIRGDDHISNTPRQILMFKALGLDDIPEFAHLPMILGSDGSRLSKRHGATSVIEYKSLGYLPEALDNYLALLGWAPGTEREIFSLEELVKEFSLGRVGSSAAIFNPEKLEWMNGEYIRATDLDVLTKEILDVDSGEAPFIKTAEFEYLKSVVALEQERLKTLTEFPEMTKFFFEEDVEYDQAAWDKIMTQEHVPGLLNGLKDKLGKLTALKAEDVEKMMRDLAAEMGIKTSLVFHPLRVAVSGRMVGPSLFHMVEVLGKDRVLKRITDTLQLF
jgi:glutamyl-tRNA synthetase